MKARDIIPDWPRGTSTSKPYESNMSSVWWWPYLRGWPREDRLKLLHEQAMEKEYREAQNRMMDDWHRSRSQSTSVLTHMLFAGELLRPDFPADNRWDSGSAFVDMLRQRSAERLEKMMKTVLAGKPYWEPLEDHTWPTYGGITRNSAPNSWLNSVPNWTPSDAGNITLEELQKQYAKVKHLQPDKMLPPYYRCHPITYLRLLSQTNLEPKHVERMMFNAITVVEDTAVPLGEFWPPEGWKADE